MIQSEQIDAEVASIEQQIILLQAKKNKLLSNAFKVDVNTHKIESKKITVIGGSGLLGSLFVKLFRQHGHRVSVIEADDWTKASSTQALASAELVLVAVPIHFTLEVIDRLGVLSPECILADITSIKRRPLSKMLKVHKGPVVGLHPMFGAGVDSFEQQTMVVCDGRGKQQYQWLIEQLINWQCKLHFTKADNHDETMAIVQVLRHFSTVAYGAHLAKENVCLEEVVAMSSPIYRLELAMVGRLFAQNPELYTEIIFSEPDNINMMKRYINQFEQLLSLLEKRDKEAFKACFLEVRDWFGDYADRFLADSNQMLNSNK